MRCNIADNAATFYEKGSNWYQFSSLCKNKFDHYHDNIKAQKLALKKAQQERTRHAALNQPFSPELLATIHKRRAEHKIMEIVVVEDDPFSRKLVHSSLNEFYAVSSAADGHNAISNYVFKAPNVMFLDIDLPDISGHEVLKKILEIDPDAYIIMLSGNGDKDNIMKAIQHGAKGFVAKPFTKDKLFTYIEKAPSFKQKVRA
jgi:two-component system chemotaxis response regulator CheY